MWRKIGSGLLATLVVVIALGTTAVASAAGEGVIDGVVGVHGEIVALTATTMTVQVGERVVETLLTADTRYRVIGEDDPGADDLAPGDRVLVRGRRTEADTLLAWWVGKVPAGQRQRGRLVAVEAKSIVLATNKDDRVRVSVMGATVVARGGDDYLWGEGGQEQLRVGMPVFVFGDANEEASPTAATIVVVPRGRLLAPRNLRGGSIVALGEGNLTLETPGHGTITVVTDESTRYRIPGVSSAALADFEVGDEIVVVGRAINEGVFGARLLSSKPEGKPIAGTIADIDGELITLQARNGETWTVLTNAATRFHAGRCRVTADSFAPGDRVIVLGERQEDGNTLIAQHVARRTFRPACRLHPFSEMTTP